MTRESKAPSGNHVDYGPPVLADRCLYAAKNTGRIHAHVANARWDRSETNRQTVIYPNVHVQPTSGRTAHVLIARRRIIESAHHNRALASRTGPLLG